MRCNETTENFIDALSCTLKFAATSLEILETNIKIFGMYVLHRRVR